MIVLRAIVCGLVIAVSRAELYRFSAGTEDGLSDARTTLDCAEVAEL